MESIAERRKGYNLNMCVGFLVLVYAYNTFPLTSEPMNIHNNPLGATVGLHPCNKHIVLEAGASEPEVRGLPDYRARFLSQKTKGYLEGLTQW